MPLSCPLSAPLGSWSPLPFWPAPRVAPPTGRTARQDALEAATDAYAAALRWGYYETAVGYLHPEKRKVVEVPKALANIRVTRYDVVQPPVPVGETERVQVVQIDYLHQDVQSVRSLTDRQTWRYDAPTQELVALLRAAGLQVTGPDQAAGDPGS